MLYDFIVLFGQLGAASKEILCLPGNHRKLEPKSQLSFLNLSEGAEFGLHRLLCADALEGTDGCYWK